MIFPSKERTLYSYDSPNFHMCLTMDNSLTMKLAELSCLHQQWVSPYCIDGILALSIVLCLNVLVVSELAVSALYINYAGPMVGNELRSGDHCATLPQFKFLKELCEVKQIQLDLSFAASDDEEFELIQEAESVHATLIVISPPSHQRLWNLERKSSSLTQKAPPGCSVAIVKGNEVLFYSETSHKASNGSEEFTFCEDPQLNTSYWRTKGSYPPFGSLQKQFSYASSPLWARADDDESSQSAGKTWQMQKGKASPRGVHDLFESALSSPSSSSHSSLSPAISQKGTLLVQDDVDEDLEGKTHYCLGFLRSRSICQTLAFSPSRSLKRLSGPLDYTSMRSSLKSYVNTLWGTESMRHDPPISADGRQGWRCFFYDEVAFATGDFNPDNLVGKGGHSEVYKGTLLDGRIVAIKRLRKGGPQEIKERDFLTELGVIGHVVHPNTIRLVGFCVEEGLHLIFEFASNGSLATWLHGVNAPLLKWPARYKIAVGVARGLHYLHTACPRRTIHRDIKASNILLGPEFEPQISDFGLAKWLPEQWPQLSVFPVEGTFGYLAPEYFRHGIVHEKTDVFAFGVLLLELITGRQPIDEKQQSLVMWAKPLLDQSRIKEIADPRLDGAYDYQEMQMLVLAAGLCVQSSAVSRPYIGQVLELLISEHSESFSFAVPPLEYHEDSSEEYNSAVYRGDLNRHREIALQF